MKKLTEINMIQKRVATGNDTSEKTNLYLSDGFMGLKFYEKDDIDENMDVYGKVEINHPAIMAGSWEECISDMSRIAMNELIEKGIVKENSYGYTYL